MCNLLSCEELKSELQSLLDGQLIDDATYRVLLKHTQSAQATSEWAYRVFQELRKLPGDKTPVDMLAYGASSHHTPVLALITAIRAVEVDDIGLFAATVKSNLHALCSCKAVCFYLHTVTCEKFKSIAAGQRFSRLFSKIEYCRANWSKCSLGPFGQEEIDVIFKPHKKTYGYKTLAEYGHLILDQKHTYEQALMELNSGVVQKMRSLGPTLFVLRRYNSYSPILNYRANYGGGYFLWTGTEGIAIDPGFDFIKNCILAQLPLFLITKIIVTHAHPDHLADLPNLLILFHEYNEYALSRGTTEHCSRMAGGIYDEVKEYDPKKSELYLSLSVYTYLNGILGLAHEQKHYKIDILQAGREYQITDKITLIATPTVHTDCIAANSGIGLIFKCHRKRTSFVYTSDTCINIGLLDEYLRIFKLHDIKNHIILCNVGGVHESELGALLFTHKLLSQEHYTVPPYDYRYPNHLGILGVAAMVNALKPEVMLIGELGGETERLRADVAESIGRELSVPCLIADMGFTLKPFDRQCYALSQNGRTSLYDLCDVNEVEHEENIMYLDRDITDIGIIKNNIAYNDKDSWRNNLPL
jgi:hypothetical protein